MIYTRQDVENHNLQNDLWIIIENKVYDLTEFINFHPGGKNIILEKAGQDATYSFNQMGHSMYARNIMNRYFIGNLESNNIVKPLDIGECRTYLDIRQKNAKIFENILKYYSIIFYFCIYDLLVYKRIKEYIFGYFLAQNGFMFFHYIAHVNFINAGNIIHNEVNRYLWYKCSYDGYLITYTHHYINSKLYAKYSILHNKIGFDTFGFYISMIITVYFPYYFVLYISKNITFYPSSVLLSLSFHMIIQEPGHDYFHVPYYYQKYFFRNRRLYPEYLLLKLYENLFLLNKSLHKFHHSHDYNNKIDSEDFDDYGMLYIWTYTLSYFFKKGYHNINCIISIYYFFTFSIISTIFFFNVSQRYMLLAFVINIIQQSCRYYIYNDEPDIYYNLNKIKLIRKIDHGSNFTLIFHSKNIYIPILGYCFFNIYNLNDSYEHNNTDNHDFLDIIQRTYTPIDIDNSNNTISINVKKYNKNEKYPDGGKGSQYLNSINIGDTIDTYIPNKYDIYIENNCLIKNFIHKKSFPLNYINIIFGGSGVTPFIRLLETLKKYTIINIKLLCFGNNLEDIPLINQLETFSQYKQIHLTIYIDKHIDTNIINTHLFRKEYNPITLICGPLGLLLSSYDLLVNKLNYNKEYVIKL
tara:strand:- start:120 stop:2033 length:1914 start_codon:yes stop_codon:yes gene_type:complete